MFVSKQLKEKNIAEYLIYMWQIEDLIRANGCDIEKIKSTIIAPYPLTEEQKAELTQWYMDLIEMMRHDGKKNVSSSNTPFCYCNGFSEKRLFRNGRNK